MALPAEIMTPDSWRVLRYCQHYWETKKSIPDLKTIKNALKLTPAEIEACFSNKAFQLGWETKGMPWEIEEQSIGLGLKASDHTITPKQIAVANVMLDVFDHRSDKEKLKDMGINPLTYKGWCNQKAFKEYVTEKGEELFGSHMGNVHAALTKEALKGNFNAIKFFYEISGRHDSAKSIEHMNVKFMVIQLIEAVKKHVQDPMIMQAIASEFDAILKEPISITSGQKAIQ